MAEILPFDSGRMAGRSRTAAAGNEESGVVIIFPGVRYERPDEDGSSQGSVAAGSKRAAKRAKRRG